jgi:chemotaxis methyl-accepting protein methylase
VTLEATAIARMESDPRLQPVALSALLIGVSAFFRDAPVFRAIGDGVVPGLRERPGPIRVLSVGCSNGAELYSVAMLLADANLLDRAWLLGIDCRADAIACAREGVFTPEVVADVPPATRWRHFEAVRDGWRIAAPLRRRTAWDVSDATRSVPAGPWDLVLCRNLVIYLQASAAARVFRSLAASLAPRGYLVVGKAERPPTGLTLTSVGRCIYRAC